MIVLDLKVVIVSDYLLLALPMIEEAVKENHGEVVAVESEINIISLNRNIKKRSANLLILAISERDSICKMIRDVKRKHPKVIIITIAKKAAQIPNLIKTKMVEAILFVNEDIKLLVKAIKQVIMGHDYYSPKVSREMAKKIASDLTPREQDILELIDQNRSRTEISSILKISYNTVSTHIRNIEKKRAISILI